MASSSDAAAGLAYTGMHDLRLRPRLLRVLLAECIPLPDPDVYQEPTRRPSDLAHALCAIREQGLLAERAPDPGLMEEWRAAVDAWVDRLLALLVSSRVHSCWVGTSFLGVTIEQCCDDRFAKSYSDWFEKILKRLKAPSSMKMVNMATCTTMADLFVRLARFPNLKDEATSLAQKVILPSLRMLQDNDPPVAEKAADLVGVIMELFPSSVYRHYNKVESTIVTKILSGQCNLQQSKARNLLTLALLPHVRVSPNSLSLMIRKILMVVNNLLHHTLFGLVEGKIFDASLFFYLFCYTGHEIMMQLIPPGSQPPPQLGGQATHGDGNISAEKFCTYVVPTISALIHCCSTMLTNSYPIQVNIPVVAVVTFIQQVLLTDVPFHKSTSQSNTTHQEFIYAGIPALHSTFLDLLGAIIQGMRSSLLPHAASIVSIITEYFKRAKLPAVRRKLYTIVQLSLSSMGVGMAMYLIQVVVSNISSDLNDNSGSNISGSSRDPVGETNWSSSKKSSRSNQTLHGQKSTAVSPESSCIRKSMPSLCVKTAALETLEVLLNVSGSLRACHWRAEMDLLVFNVARETFYKMGMYEQTPLSTEDSNLSDFQLASFKALLASFLSSPYRRPPYLEEGLELFNRGMLENDTELAKFCSHALLSLGVLVHPQEDLKIPLKRAAHGGLGTMSGAREIKVLDSGKSKHYVRKHGAVENSGDGVNNWLFRDDGPRDAFVEGNTAEKHAANDMSIDPLVLKDTAITEHQEIVPNEFHGEVQDVPTSHSFNVDSSPISTTLPDPQGPGDAAFSNKKDGQPGGIISGTTSGNQTVATNTAPMFDASGRINWREIGEKANPSFPRQF
ncbi:hypothetical protein ABZP36_020722 [Zizania latifolia]